jgi:periplasmic copper chaperone A
MRSLSLLLLGCFVALFADGSLAQGADSSIQVVDAWARQAPMMPPMGSMSGGTGNAALYVTLRNVAADPDPLLGASSAAAGHVELHETIRDGEVMRMRPVTQLVVPAGGVLEMKPGGLHIMLINLKRALRPGDRVPVTLTFGHAAPLSLDVQVR